MIRNTICNICLSYLNPFIHLCPSVTSSCSRSQCRTYSYRYMWIGTPILLPPPHSLSFITLWFVWLLSFQNHLWYVHGAKHKYHGWNPQNICTVRRKLSPRIKRGGGGLCTSLCTYWPYLGSLSREIPVFNFQRTVCWFKLTLECNNNCKLLNFNHSK